MPKNLLNLLPEESFIREWPGCWPFSEAPESFQILAVISGLGAVVGRNAWFRYGDKETIPLLPVLLLGPPGVGKSRTIGYVERLVNSVDQGIRPHAIPPCTKEELYYQMSVRSKAVMYASELAAYFSTEKYKENVVPAVTELLDYPLQKTNATRKDGVVTINNPALTVIGGSTIPWFQERLPKSANEGGFLARFLIVHENEKGKITDPLDLDEEQEFEQERKISEVFARFQDCASMKGRLYLDKHWGARDVFSQWKRSYNPPDNVKATFSSRKEEFVFRLAINIALSCGSMIIDETHMTPATKLYEYAMESLAPVIVPLTAVGKAQSQIIELAGKDGKTNKQICRALNNAYSSRDIMQWIEGLKFSGSLTERDGKYYEA